MIAVVHGAPVRARFTVTGDGKIYTEIVPYVETIAILSDDEKKITVYERWINRFGQVSWQSVYVYWSEGNAETPEETGSVD